jgi:cell division septal protein FtsQ
MSKAPERSRAEQVRLRRREQAQQRITKSTEVATRPMPPIMSRGAMSYGSLERAKPQPTRQRFDTALSMPGFELRMPVIRITSAGIKARLFSVFLSLLLGTALYMSATRPEFYATAAQVTGNQRIRAEEINAVLNISGQSIFMLTGAQLETRLRLNYPDITAAHVTIGLPNVVHVEITERQPLLLWQQANGFTWIDANGIAFRPRGEPANLIPVMALAAPPTAQAAKAADPLSPMPFISPDLVKAIQTVAPQVPAGTTIEYDPKYGLGWSDSRGWKVFFGDSAKDMPLKLRVYQSLVDSLMQKGIQPAFISVQYANAPYYRMSE